MINFQAILIVSILINVGMTTASLWKFFWTCCSNGVGVVKKEDDDDNNNALRHHLLLLLKRYLPVYLLATMSDWLQGPYVLAVYAEYVYSYTPHQVKILFLAGFVSSLIFGSFVGSMADWGGRRAFVILYAILYSLSCLAMHFQSYPILLMGRLLGGIATNLLYTVLESWLVRAHRDLQLDSSFLVQSMSCAAYGNSVIAIVAKVTANYYATSSVPFGFVRNSAVVYYGGNLIPFDMALGTLVLCGLCARMLWEENYGTSEQQQSTTTSAVVVAVDDDESSKDFAVSGDNSAINNTIIISEEINNNKWYNGLYQALRLTLNDKEILLLGIISSFYEASMYFLTFLWIPALVAANTGHNDGFEMLPLMVIFNTLMMCGMIGSSMFAILMSNGWRVETVAVMVLGLACCSMWIMVWMPSCQILMYMARCTFQFTMGMYWPTMGSLKARIVPESHRAAIYNLYRVPTNMMVLISLSWNDGGWTPTTNFSHCGILLIVATGLQVVLLLLRRRHEQEIDNDDQPQQQQHDDDDDKEIWQALIKEPVAPSD